MECSKGCLVLFSMGRSDPVRRIKESDSSRKERPHVLFLHKARLKECVAETAPSDCPVCYEGGGSHCP